MPPPDRWFEDFTPGQVFEFGDYKMTLAEILGFATRYDPQPFHTDPDAARGSAFGELVASGWNTAAIAMRLLVDHFIPANSAMGSPGVDELRWTRPVKPGDRLSMRVTITETRLSRSKPDRGIVHNTTEVLNQHNEVVMTMRGMAMFRARPASVMPESAPPLPAPTPAPAPTPRPASPPEPAPSFPGITIPQASLAEIFHAQPGALLRGRAAGTQTGEAVDIALPPLHLGAQLMPALDPHETPGGAKWDDPSFRSMIPWVCGFPDVMVHGDGGIVVTGGTVVADTLIHVVEARQGFAKTEAGIVLHGGSPPVALEGTWLSLLCGSHWNYYHWMIDGIGRLAAADPATLARCRGVLVPANLAPFAAQTLALSGIARNLEVWPLGPTDAVTIPHLLVPWRMADGFWPHPDLHRFLATLVPQTPHNPSLPRRIYIDRRGTQNRPLVNEDEVIAALAGANVVPIPLETLSLAAQAALFRQAELIVAPHGAGLTNLVFARPACRVVELVMDAYQHWAFRRLAALGNLDYDCVPGRALPGQPTEWVHDLRWTVSPMHVQAAIAAALGW